VAIDTAKLEISRLVLAEAQRRSAKIARERLQEEAPAQADDKRVEYCQEVARAVANDAVNSVVEEIADPSVADLDLEKARELALSAASAVAREFSGAYQLTPDYDGSRVSTKTLVFLAIQIFTGCFIVWFFLLGGYETCEPMMKAVLPQSLYSSIYRAVPARHHQVNQNGKGDVEDLIDDQAKPGGAGKEGGEDEVPTVKPADSSAKTPDGGSVKGTRDGAARTETAAPGAAPGETEVPSTAPSVTAPSAPASVEGGNLNSSPSASSPSASSSPASSPPASSPATSSPTASGTGAAPASSADPGKTSPTSAK
jgi:hypothetical protein